MAYEALPFLLCFVGKETFSKRTSDDKTGVPAIFDRQSILRKLRLLIPWYIISTRISGIEYMAYCILLGAFVYNSLRICVFNFLFSVHLTEWTVNKISVGISALISFLGLYFDMSTSSICLLSDSLLGLEHRCYCKRIWWIFDRVCLMFTSNERSPPLFIGISAILRWLHVTIHIRDIKQTGEHNLWDKSQ